MMWNKTSEQYWDSTVDMRFDVKIKTGTGRDYCEVYGVYRETSDDIVKHEEIAWLVGYHFGAIAESLIERSIGKKPEAYREAARQFAETMNFVADDLEKSTARVTEDMA